MAEFPTTQGRGPITFQAKTADYTVKKSENGTGFTNTGASAVVVFNLPPAEVGMHYYFVVDDTDGIRINPDASETIALPSTGVPGAGGKYLTADAKNESVHLICAVAGTWSVLGFTGTWTAEG